MAGDWIKMRAALMSAPKLIALSRHLHKSREFREWLTPGGSGSVNGQIVSDDGLRCVTCSLLLRVWSASREFGKTVDNDLILPHIEVSDIDAMAGAPGVGEAMLAVGWATVPESGGAVVLPNFKQHNAPMTPAEKQSQYRARSREKSQTVTGYGNKTVTREEKRREENKENTHKRFVPPTEQEVAAYAAEKQLPLDPSRFMSFYESKGWMVGKNKMVDWKAAARGFKDDGKPRAGPSCKQTAADRNQESFDQVRELFRERGNENEPAAGTLRLAVNGDKPGRDSGVAGGNGRPVG